MNLGWEKIEDLGFSIDPKTTLEELESPIYTLRQHGKILRVGTLEQIMTAEAAAICGDHWSDIEGKQDFNYVPRDIQRKRKAERDKLMKERAARRKGSTREYSERLEKELRNKSQMTNIPGTDPGRGEGGCHGSDAVW